VDTFDGASVIDSATRAIRWGGLLFLPVALWTPDGWGNGVSAERLEAYSTGYLPTGIQPDGDNWLDFYNALWVRARLPVALGFAPPTCRHALRWQFLNAGLLAVKVEVGGPQVTPFVCTDHDLQAELRFGRSCPEVLRREIATAFWGLLASAPAALASYRDRFIFDDGHDLSPTVVGYWRGLFHLGNCRR
jgi:hypothetical protein